MSDPLGPVTIYPQQIYDQLVRLQASVDRLVDRHDAQAAEVVDHEARLRSLERGRWPLPSLAVVVSLVALVLGVLPLLAGGPHR